MKQNKTNIVKNNQETMQTLSEQEFNKALGSIHFQSEMNQPA